MNIKLASIGRTFALSLLGMLCFIVGLATTLLVATQLFKAPAECQPPCDAPAYLALGVTALIGPVVGILSAVIGVSTLAARWRRKQPRAS